MDRNTLRRFAPSVIAGASILALVFITFGASLWHDFAPIDDLFLVRDNLAIRGITVENLTTIFTTFDPELYIPLTLFSFQINYLLGGLQPFVYHLTNLLMHAGNAMAVGWVLFLVVERMIGDSAARTHSTSSGLAAALVGGLIFAVHPLHAEAVVWIAGRKDLLSAFFMLLAFGMYLRYREKIRSTKSEIRRMDHLFGFRASDFVLSLVFFLLALLSKAMAITLPVVLILHDVILEGRQLRRAIWDKLPYVALSALFIVIAAFGKERILANSGMLETALMGARSSMFYLQKLFLPTGLSLFYPHNGPIAATDPVFLLPAILVVALVIVAVLVRRRTPWLSFGILFYLITLSPTFLNFHKGSMMFFAVDRYAYVPSVGILLIVLTAAGLLLERFRSLPKPVPIVTATAIIGIFTLLSMRQTSVWASPRSLYANALRHYPESITARTDLARLDREEGRYQEAFKTLQDGLRYGDHPALHLAAGFIYAKVGQVPDAEAQFREAMQMDPKNPEPHYHLGALAEHAGRTDDAMALYRTAVDMDPSYVAARVKLGNILLQKGDVIGAREQFEEAVKWNPSAEEARAGMKRLEKPNTESGLQ